MNARETIRTEALRYATAEQTTTLVSRLGLGRCILRLQRERDDRYQGQVTYKPARLVVLGWVRPANASLSDTILKQATRLAQRIEEPDVVRLAALGMTFWQLYAASKTLPLDSDWRREVGLWLTRKVKDFARYERAIIAAQQTPPAEAPAVLRIPANGCDGITIPVVPTMLLAVRELAAKLQTIRWAYNRAGRSDELKAALRQVWNGIEDDEEPLSAAEEG